MMLYWRSTRNEKMSDGLKLLLTLWGAIFLFGVLIFGIVLAVDLPPANCIVENLGQIVNIDIRLGGWGSPAVMLIELNDGSKHLVRYDYEPHATGQFLYNVDRDGAIKMVVEDGEAGLCK
jgi:hypothetical protein